MSSFESDQQQAQERLDNLSVEQLHDIEGRLVAQKRDQANAIKQLMGQMLRLDEKKAQLTQQQTELKDKKTQADTKFNEAKQVSK